MKSAPALVAIAWLLTAAAAAQPAAAQTSAPAVAQTPASAPQGLFRDDVHAKAGLG